MQLRYVLQFGRSAYDNLTTQCSEAKRLSVDVSGWAGVSIAATFRDITIEVQTDVLARSGTADSSDRCPCQVGQCRFDHNYQLSDECQPVMCWSPLVSVVFMWLLSMRNRMTVITCVTSGVVRALTEH